MSFIQRKFTKVKCDNCTASEDFYSFTFAKDKFKRELRSRGWTFGENGDLCPVCSEMMANGRVTKRGMHYRCESCGYKTIMWLEKGLEEGGPTQKPVPFTIKCNACGEFLHGMRHVAWNEDARLPFYRPILDGWNYFQNNPDHECGIPVFAKREGGSE